MPIGITLILIVYNEQQFDVQILNILLIARYHPIRKETCFLVVIVNPCYYKFVSIKNEVNKILYYNSIHFIQRNMVTNRFQLLIYHQISSNFLICKCINYISTSWEVVLPVGHWRSNRNSTWAVQHTIKRQRLTTGV